MQLLFCAKEELGIKRKLAGRMDHMDKEFNENMTRLSTNMEKLINSISEGFTMLHALIGQQSRFRYSPLSPHPQLGYPFHPVMLPTSSPASFGAPSTYSSYDSTHPDTKSP